MIKALIPIPEYGFDPTEASIPWLQLSKKGINVVFATPNAKQATADVRMLTGKGLGIWKPILQARSDAVEAYYLMTQSHSFQNPIFYNDINPDEYDIILLPGGHDKAIRPYLESKILQNCICNFFLQRKLVAAICHGVILAARSIDKNTATSVLYTYQTTCLLKKQELLAYHLTRLWLHDYYRTYPSITVEDEVRSFLQYPNQLQKGNEALFRDSSHNLKPGFVCIDRNYISARWPGDVYSFSNAILNYIQTHY